MDLPAGFQFRTETSTFNYAGQILDLSTHHTLEQAPKVQVPILVLGPELDQVAVAAKSSLVANLFSRTRHVELPGASHYSFYDRPELVASLMESFLSGITCRREPRGRYGDCWILATNISRG